MCRSTPDSRQRGVTELARESWHLTGATASGKTSVGLELAERIHAEIISLDSMAIYRGMDIGTAKPSLEERRRVAHHLIDILAPCEEFSLADYLDAAHEKMEEIRARGRQVLFVGGTPLYLKALLRGIYRGPPADWRFRREVEAETREVGVAALHERLQRLDPLAAAKLHPNDVRRIIRALEVYKATGRPASHMQTQFDEGRPAHQCRVFAISWPREVLHQRIDTRVEQMFHAGLVDEVRGLLQQHGELSRTAAQAVGYREIMEYLQGQRNLRDTVEAVKSRTRRFARRQETWFRSLSECRRLTLTAAASPAEVADQIVAWVAGKTV